MGGVSVLVVDDEPSLRLLCRVNLDLDGFDVHEAGTISEAREQLEERPISVVVLDVHVGAEDGRDLLGELRAQESPTRVLMLTGTADIATSNLDDADRVMAKPFDPAALVAAVRQLAEADGNGELPA
jgi:two-component system alkaline phosphatase synthesis response regulator PhoP